MIDSFIIHLISVAIFTLYIYIHNEITSFVIRQFLPLHSLKTDRRANTFFYQSSLTRDFGHQNIFPGTLHYYVVIIKM